MYWSTAVQSAALTGALPVVYAGQVLQCHHKKSVKNELRYVALFKHPLPKEDCLICVMLTPATILFVTYQFKTLRFQVKLMCWQIKL